MIDGGSNGPWPGVPPQLDFIFLVFSFSPLKKKPRQREKVPSAAGRHLLFDHVTGNFDYENERMYILTACVCIFSSLIFWWSEQKFQLFVCCSSWEIGYTDRRFKCMLIQCRRLVVIIVVLFFFGGGFKLKITWNWRLMREKLWPLCVGGSPL